MIEPIYRDTEFLRPLVEAWRMKVSAAKESNARRQWIEIVEECLIFYHRSANAMWDPSYTRRVWANVKAPKFRFSMNKCFELVAIFGPNLMWSVPHRQVEPKSKLELSEDLLESNPQIAQMLQQYMPMQRAAESEDKIIAHLMQTSLNYFSREQPGGLGAHSKRCVVDALLMGRGALFSRPYYFPDSDRQLVGSFHEDPRNIYLDPDFPKAMDSRWQMVEHRDPYPEVEKRFKLPKGSLRSAATQESSWRNSEMNTTYDSGQMMRQEKHANDLMVWYECYSKSGVGASSSGMMSPVREHLEKVAEQYVYICFSPHVPYPLNCPSEEFRKGAKDDDIKRKLRWPVPIHKDNRYPSQFLDFYHDPDGPYPIPPMAPGLGELKFMNFMLPWLANRIHNSSRDFWSVLSPHVEHYKKHLQEADDLGIIPTPTLGPDDVRKTLQVIQHAETRMDAWRILEAVAENFEKRTGMTEHAYGRNEGGTQDRTAETTLARNRAVGVRPEFMANEVVDWQSEVASVEAFLARTFVSGKDLAPLLGPVGVMLWDMHVRSRDIERSTRQMRFTVAASSMRRPNRERAANNFTALLNSFAGIIQSYAESTGDYGPVNALFKQFGSLNDFDTGEFQLQPPEPDPQQQQMEQQAQEHELRKMEADLAKLQIEIEIKRIEAQNKMQQAAISQQQGVQKIELSAAQQALQMQSDQARFQQDFTQDQATHLLGMIQDSQKHIQDMRQDSQKHRLDLKQKRQMGKANLQAKQRLPSPSKNGAG